jgi:transglutaminase-like putative cysteine protease
LERHDLDTLIATLGTVDHRGVDWQRVRRTAYLIHQHLRYEYPGEVRDLRQRLVIVPPERYGGQRLVTHKLEVSQSGGDRDDITDPFGNRVLSLYAAHVANTITFTAWIVVERDADAGPVEITSAAYHNVAFRQPSALTAPDDTLLAAAAEWRASGLTGRSLARQINGWVYGQMRYAHGLTGVKTSAAEAFALRQGVCQDYAHVMIAICRACDLPARYVSGHLLGEGGTHAWLEVLLPGERAGTYVAHPLDPTHGTEPGLNYITIAVGRDYGDVAPTSGTFRAPYGGQLSTSKRAGVTALEYFTAER